MITNTAGLGNMQVGMMTQQPVQSAPSGGMGGLAGGISGALNGGGMGAGGSFLGGGFNGATGPAIGIPQQSPAQPAGGMHPALGGMPPQQMQQLLAAHPDLAQHPAFGGTRGIGNPAMGRMARPMMGNPAMGGGMARPAPTMSGFQTPGQQQGPLGPPGMPGGILGGPRPPMPPGQMQMQTDPGYSMGGTFNAPAFTGQLNAADGA